MPSEGKTAFGWGNALTDATTSSRYRKALRKAAASCKSPLAQILKV